MDEKLVDKAGECLDEMHALITSLLKKGIGAEMIISGLMTILVRFTRAAAEDEDREKAFDWLMKCIPFTWEQMDVIEKMKKKE